MGDETRVLRFDWRNKNVDIKVDVDKCNLLDIVVEYEDEAKKMGLRLDYHYPEFSYVYKMDHCYLVADKDLVLMFERIADKVITIWVGTCLKPNQLYKLVLNFRRQNERTNAKVIETLPSLDNLEDNSVFVAGEHSKQTTSKKPTTKKASVKKPTTKKVPVKIPFKAPRTNLPPPPVSPKTAFQSLIVRRSPRFSPIVTEKAPINPTTSLPEHSLFDRKIPKTTARRKGLSTIQIREMATGSKNVRICIENVPAKEEMVESSDGRKTAKRKMVFDEDHFPTDEAPSDSDSSNKQLDVDLYEGMKKIAKVKDNWKAGIWHDFLDDDNDDHYYQRLYKNGEIYENKEMGKIKLKPWMIFMDKKHFKDTLRDYCIQEGFAITILKADNTRYTATCSALCCTWRIHASRLTDGITWAIKKIDPDTHTCRGLETYNPICNVKWAAAKLMEDIRANPDIPGTLLALRSYMY